MVLGFSAGQETETHGARGFPHAEDRDRDLSDEELPRAAPSLMLKPRYPVAVNVG